MRTVLLASLGLSPAVITETIWAMMHPADGATPTVPDLVHVLTTQPRGQAAFDALAEKIRARIGMLCAQFGHPVPAIEVEAVVDPDTGKSIADVSTQRENILFAGRITALVHRYAQDPGIRIHMSLVGGRKSMSFGRVQDELTHVLVDPAELEFCGDTLVAGPALRGQPARRVRR
jgi:CRISPR-associated protein (TIGR02584 family)